MQETDDEIDTKISVIRQRWHAELEALNAEEERELQRVHDEFLATRDTLRPQMDKMQATEDAILKGKDEYQALLKQSEALREDLERTQKALRDRVRGERRQMRLGAEAEIQALENMRPRPIPPPRTTPVSQPITHSASSPIQRPASPVVSLIVFIVFAVTWWSFLLWATLNLPVTLFWALLLVS